MGLCVSVTYLAPCSHCCQDKLEFHKQERDFRKIASYKTKPKLSESLYHMLKGFGYKEMFHTDKERPIYSCDSCYQEYGIAMPEVWIYNEKGFIRHVKLKRR